MHHKATIIAPPKLHQKQSAQFGIKLKVSILTTITRSHHLIQDAGEKLHLSRLTQFDVIINAIIVLFFGQNSEQLTHRIVDVFFEIVVLLSY
jgi:hypothetical protein